MQTESHCLESFMFTIQEKKIFFLFQQTLSKHETTGTIEHNV
jgi:hypothetical protein